jgi:hypothetical protein
MKKMALAVAAAAAVGLGGVAAPFAQASGLHITITPLRPHQGQPMTAHVTGGPPNSKDYLCIESMYKAGVKPSAAEAYTPSYQKIPKLSPSGAGTCHMVFLKFHVKIGGKTLYCPPTAANKRAGWKCGVATANFVTRKQFVFALFRF